MVRTTLPKVEKVGTSLAEAPTARSLAAWMGSKAPDGTPTDDNPDLLSFTKVESWITWWMSSLLQNY
jgi:hypothetical protein